MTSVVVVVAPTSGATVVVVVGRPSLLPREPQQALASDAGAGWVAMRDQIFIEE